MNEGHGVDVDCWVPRTGSWVLSDAWKKAEGQAVDPDLRYKQHLRMDLKAGTLSEGSLDGWSLNGRREGGWYVLPPAAKGEPPANE